MAKKRFPSEANQSKSGDSAPAQQEQQAQVVEGKPAVLVQVHYKKDNTHHLSGVHSLIKGVNHLPVAIWEEAKKHPSVQKLIAENHAEELPGEGEQEETAKE